MCGVTEVPRGQEYLPGFPPDVASADREKIRMNLWADMYLKSKTLCVDEREARISRANAAVDDFDAKFPKRRST